MTSPYRIQIIPYEKDKQSKIELVKEILTTLPKPPHKGYILADSWYTCETLFQIANQLGFYYLGGIKTNRIILPKGYRPKGIQLKSFAKHLIPQRSRLSHSWIRDLLYLYI